MLCAVVDRWNPKNESSFDITNKKKRTTQKDFALASYVITLRDQSWRLSAQVLVCQVEQKWVTGEKFRGSVAEVYVSGCASMKGGLGGAAQNIYKEQAKQTIWFLPETLVCVQ